MGPRKTLSEWGFEWQHLENDLMMGQPKEPVIKNWSDLDTSARRILRDTTRFDAMKKTRAELGDDKYYKANFVLTGFTVMAFLRGFSQMLEDMYLERENIERLADMVFGFEEEVIKQLKPQGFDSVAFADDWGTQESLFISPKLWREDLQTALQAPDRDRSTNAGSTSTSIAAARSSTSCPTWSKSGSTFSIPASPTSTASSGWATISRARSASPAR